MQAEGLPHQEKRKGRVRNKINQKRQSVTERGVCLPSPAHWTPFKSLFSFLSISRPQSFDPPREQLDGDVGCHSGETGGMSTPRPGVDVMKSALASVLKKSACQELPGRDRKETGKRQERGRKETSGRGTGGGVQTETA